MSGYEKPNHTYEVPRASTGMVSCLKILFSKCRSNFNLQIYPNILDRKFESNARKGRLLSNLNTNTKMLEPFCSWNENFRKILTMGTIQIYLS